MATRAVVTGGCDTPEKNFVGKSQACQKMKNNGR